MQIQRVKTKTPDTASLYSRSSSLSKTSSSCHWTSSPPQQWAVTWSLVAVRRRTPSATTKGRWDGAQANTTSLSPWSLRRWERETTVDSRPKLIEVDLTSETSGGVAARPAEGIVYAVIRASGRTAEITHTTAT